MRSSGKPLVNLRATVIACILGLVLWLVFGLFILYLIW
jgi:hypothetical protein